MCDLCVIQQSGAMGAIRTLAGGPTFLAIAGITPALCDGLALRSTS